MDQWLIRTSQNWIAGPYRKEQVRQMILEGKLTQDDEVCPANGYWIFLHEQEEVREHLGVGVRAVLPEPEDDVTETRIMAEMDNDETDPGISQQGKQETFQEAGLRAISESTSENTAVMDAGSLRELLPQKKKAGVFQRRAQSAPASRPGSLKGKPSKNTNQAGLSKTQRELPSFWRGLAWVLVTIGLLLLGGIFWLLAK